MIRRYYRPTPGEIVGTWNVHHVSGATDRDVPYADLPDEVRDMIRDRSSLLH